MKLSSLLFVLLIFAGPALAQLDSGGTTSLLRINSAGQVQVGPRSEPEDTRPWGERTYELQQRNNLYSGQGASNPVPCTVVQPGMTNFVFNPCPTSAPLPSATNWSVVQNPCKVEYDEITEFRYGPARLKGIMIKGTHNAPFGSFPNKDFNVLDVDGFFSLTALHSDWQSRSLVQDNRTSSTPIPLPDIRSAKQIVAMGIQYHTYQEQQFRNDPNLASELPGIVLKKNFLLALGRELEIWERAQGVVPAGRIRAALSEGLEKFAPTANVNDRLLSIYPDASIGDRPNVLCNKDAVSVMVGQVVCSRDFVNSFQRNPMFCPGGINFDSLSTVRVCQAQPPGAPSVCRANLYAQDQATPSSGASPSGGSSGAVSR